MFAQNVVHNPLHDFLLIFVTAAAFGDLCRSVGRNRMVGFLPRQLTCHHTQQVIGGKFTHSRQLLVMRLVSCQGRKPTTWLRPMLLHKSPQAAGDRGQTNKFHAAFRDDLRVAEAGNRPFGYDPHSYASHHRKQLIGGKLTNFRQLLYSDDL